MTKLEVAPDPERLAQAWGEGIHQAAPAGTSPDDLRSSLLDRVHTLLAALRAEPVDAARLAALGASLVDDRLTDVAALESSLTALGRELTDPGGAPAPPDLVHQALASIAAGYAEGLRTLALREQQNIIESALAARVAAEQARWDAEARFETMFTESAVGIGIVDLGGRIIEVNPAICRMFGYRRDQVLGHRIDDFADPHAGHDDVAELPRQIRGLLSGSAEHLRLQRPYRHGDGTDVWVDLVLSPVRDRHGRPRYIVGMAVDITARRNLERRLAHEATHDPLTGLPNRALFFKRLEAAMDPARPDPSVGVCYLDLDEFKAVNDVLGHRTGDALLRAIARRFRDELVDDGHLVARMGGDEFVVLVTGESNLADIERTAQRAIEMVSRPVRLAEQSIAVSASVGVVRNSDGEGAGSAELMQAADIAMYRAKAAGGSRYAVFHDEHHPREMSRFVMGGRLPRALTRGEFMVDFEPIVRLADDRVVGAAAVVHWQLPSGERLPRDRFLPVAVESGLIVPLGLELIRQACSQLSRWRPPPGAPALVSVDLTARQLREPGFVDDLAGLLRTVGGLSGGLQLRLGRREFAAVDAADPDLLRRTAELGVRIAVDDADLGWSGLNRMRRLPVRTITLAPSDGTDPAADPFTDPATDPAANRSIGQVPDRPTPTVAAAVVGLAHLLDLTVAAVDVRTADELALLRRAGCDTAQGPAVSPPVPADEFAALIGSALADNPTVRRPAPGESSGRTAG